MTRPASMTRLGNKILVSLSLLFVFSATLAHAQQSPFESSKSVVQITCVRADGQSKATGFVWSKATYVVTALHAVAGCKRIDVWSEIKKDEDTATLIAAHLESDLALLQLPRDLGIRPLKHSTSAPDMSREFALWGYPRAVPRMFDLPLRFSRGHQDEITLGEAFFNSSDELDRQLGGQDYPKMGTKILRVGSLLQPGHSGAPIFDREGRVVAIADGGLYDGTAGINWSIPAAVYLPGLPNSKDPFPTKPSKQAVLHSAFTPKAEKTVTFEINDNTQGELKLVRTISVAQLGKLMQDDDLESYNDMKDGIQSFLGDAKAADNLSFDVYEDSVTGASIAVPTGLEPKWNKNTRVLETATDKGTIRFLTGIVRKDSFAAASQDAMRDFMNGLNSLASWDENLAGVDYSYIDEDWEYAQLGNFYDGTDKETGNKAQVLVQLEVEGQEFLGSAVYVGGDPESDEFSDDDIVVYMMMQLSRELTDFAKR